MKKPIILVICGSDCSGGAGCQADLLTCRDFDVHVATVITAITAQNAQEVLEIYYCDSHLIQMQINSLEQAFAPSVVKIGLLGKKSTLITVNSYLQNYKGFIVCDPVLKSTSGVSFTKPFDLIKLIFPYINLLTINIPEAEILLQKKNLFTRRYGNSSTSFFRARGEISITKGWSFKL